MPARKEVDMAQTRDTKAAVVDALQTVVLIGPLIKTLFALIVEAEDPNVPGDQKKASVLTFVEQLLRAAATKVPGIDDAGIALAKEAAGWVIDAYVAFKNFLGHFTHKSTTTTT
jgi:hypothetical protein